jgi:alpha-tubulin suppressor-like RCC1 family protein
MALTRNGFLFTWGFNGNGQLGLGDYEDRWEPTHVKSMVEHRLSDISAGHSHSACLDDAGNLFTWGANPDCRLMKSISYYKRSGKPKNVLRPTMCPELSHLTIIKIALGTTHTLVIDIGGSVYSSGSPECGQLGDYLFNPKKSDKPFVKVPIFSEKLKCV